MNAGDTFREKSALQIKGRKACYPATTHHGGLALNGGPGVIDDINLLDNATGFPNPARCTGSPVDLVITNYIQIPSECQEVCALDDLSEIDSSAHVQTQPTEQ